MTRVLVDVEGAAKYLRLAPGTLDKARSLGGDWPAYLKVGRRVLYDVADLDAWLDTRRRRSTSEGAGEPLAVEPSAA